jgi:hypothetical protein
VWPLQEDDRVGDVQLSFAVWQLRTVGLATCLLHLCMLPGLPVQQLQQESRSNPQKLAGQQEERWLVLLTLQLVGQLLKVL